MKHPYEELIKTDFGIIDKIGMLITNHYSENDYPPKEIVMHNFDFELMILESQRNTSVKITNQNQDLYCFGIKVVKDYNCPLGEIFLK